MESPSLEIKISADISELHKQLVEMKEAIDTLKNNAEIKVSLTTMYSKTKKNIDNALADIAKSIDQLNKTPIDFQLANEKNTEKAINEIHRVDESLTELQGHLKSTSELFLALTEGEKEIKKVSNSIKNTTPKFSKSLTEAKTSIGELKEAIKDVPDLEIKTSVADITLVLTTLTQVTKQLNLAKAAINRISNNPEIKKLVGQAVKATPKGVPQEVFSDFTSSFEKAFSQLDIGGSIKTALKGLDFSSLTTSVNELMNKELAEKRKAEFKLEIDDKEIKGLKTRITNLIKEIKESDGKIPLELTLDLDKLRERLKAARGELDRFKKTDRFKPPLTLNLDNFKEKIKSAKEALKKFRESEETTVNLKIAINDANKVLADFNTANSSLLTDKTINVTLAYSEFDKGIKHVQEALASLKDMTIHINSNVKDVIAKEKIKEEELKEKAKAEKEKAEREKKPAFESKENYQTMLDNLMKHPLSNGKTTDGNATLQSRLSSIKTLQSAIEHGKAHRDDPNAFLVGIKEEGFLRAQREWLEKAIAAVGQNMTLSQAQKAMKTKMKDPNGYNALMENLMAFPLSDGKNITTTATVQKRLAAINKLLSVHAQGIDNPISPRSWVATAEQLQFLNDERNALIEKKNALAKGMTLEEYRDYNAQQAFNDKHKNDSAWADETESKREASRKNQEKSDLSSSRYKEEARKAAEQKEYDDAVKAAQEEAILLAGFAAGHEEIRAQNEKMTRAAENARKKLEQQKAQQQKADDDAEVAKATQATKEQERLDKEQKAKQNEINKLERKLQDVKLKYGYSFYGDKPMTYERYMKLGDTERDTMAKLNNLNGSVNGYVPVFGGSTDYKDYAAKFTKFIEDNILKAEEKLKRIQQNYGFDLYSDKPMSLKQYMKYDTREQEAIAELNRLHGQLGTTGNYSAVFGGQQGYNRYTNGYQVAKVEDELDKLQQKLADSKLGERPMKEQQFMANSTREQELIAELNKLNGTKRNSVYNGSNGYQQYLDDMRQIGKITAEEEKRNALIQRRKDIAHEYSQELRKQNQLLQSGREVSQKEIDASERRIENIRRKWDNANWGANETKPELRQSHLHGRNAQEINQQNSVRNAMAWQSQYFSTANSKVGTLTASLEKLYTELKRNPGDAGIKKYIQEVSKELKQAKKEAKEVQQNLTAHTGSLTDGWKNKLSWIGGAFGFNESYDVAREFVSTITEINEGMANLATVMPELHHSEEAMVKEQTAMIDTAAKYGATIHDVIESARLWGRMYKEDDVPGATNLLSEQSVKLAIADNFSLEESTKAVEAAMFQYGLTARSSAEALAYSNRIVDVYTKLSHSAGVSAQDLAAGVERSGSVAHQAGMDFEFLTSLIAQGTRSTALSGLTNNSPFMLETA